MKKLPCLICEAETLAKGSENSAVRTFFYCSNCHFVFSDPSLRLSEEAERARYLTHENNVNDESYQNFVQPLVDQVMSHFPIVEDRIGLDFGSGTGPVLTYLLRNQGYRIETYDPFFSPEIVMAQAKYDFIVTCEVVEHLFDPIETFKQLFSWLKPGGLLIAKTHLWEGQDFHQWYYSRDPTHVSFYSRPNLEFIRKLCGFATLEILDNRVFQFTAPPSMA